MRFDLEAHLKHHAFLFKKNGEVLPNSIHFNFSFLDLQFLDKNVEETMSKLLTTLLLPTSYNVANGKRKNRHGKVIQKFTTRKVELQADVQAMAIHLKGPEGEDTMPHIHFIANGSARFGNGYSLLKKHISVISEQFGLLPNFDEMVEHNPLSVKSLSRAVSQITWSWKKSTNAQLKSEIDSRGLDKSIALLESYCLKTKNLTYYIKSMESLKTRLNRMHIDVTYKGHQLCDTYPIPLRSEDMEVITLLQNKTFTQKAMKPYLKNPLFRDFIRHCAGTTKPYIYDAIKQQTKLLDHVSKNKQAVTNYQKLMLKETPMRKSQLTPQDNKGLMRKNELRRIIIEVSQSATNEKTFRTLMQNAGYSDFGLKKKQGKVIGCIYKELESKKTVTFTDLGLHWGELKKSFMLNSRKRDNAETLPSPTLVKTAPTPSEIHTSTIRTTTPKSVPIEYKTKYIEIKKDKAKQQSKLRRHYEKLIPGIKAEIIKFESFITRVKRGISDLRDKVFNLTKRVSRTTEPRAELNKLQTTVSNQSREIKNVTNTISRAKQNQSTLTRRFHSAREVEYQNETINDSLKRELENTNRHFRELENGDFEYFLHKKLTETIGNGRRENKELEIEIKEVEESIELEAQTYNTSSLFKMR